MTDRERNQADLLDGFARERSEVPIELDAGIAAIAVQLAAELTPPEPSARFVRQLDQRLTAGPVASSNHHQAELPAVAGTEITPQTAPADWREAAVGPRRSRLSELARLSAAVLAIMLIGSALIFMFSDREDELAPGIGADPDASTGSERLYVVAWNGVTAIETSSDTELFSIDANDPYAVLSPDGTRLYVVGAGGEDQLAAFDALSGDELWRTTVRHRHYYIPGVGSPSILNVSPDGGQLYVHSYDNAGDFGDYGSDAVNIPTWVRVIDAHTGEHLFDTEKIPGYCHAEVFASVRTGLIHEICMNTGLIRTSDNVTGSMVETVNSEARIVAALPSPNHDLIYLIGNIPRIFNAETGEVANSIDLGDLRIAQHPFGLAALSPDGNVLYVGLRYGDGSDTQRIREIAVIDTSSWTEVNRITVDVDLTPVVLSVSADGQSLYAAEQLGSETAGKLVRVDVSSGETSAVLVRNSEILRVLSSSSPVENRQPDVDDAPTPQYEPTPVDQPSATPEILTEPPRASLTYEDQTQTHGAHTYCWPMSPDGEVECMEADRGPPDLPAIQVPAGASLSFEAEGGHAFTPLGAEAVRLIPYPEPSTTALTFDFPGAGIPFEQGPDGTFLIADVPDGDYSFEAGISMDVYPGHQGNASYAFRVIVGDPSLLPTPALGGPPPDVSFAWMTYDGESQRGEFAYGCNWPGYPICVDPGGLMYPAEFLNVPEGAELTFTSDDLDGAELTHVTGVAYALADADIGDLHGVPYLRYPPPAEESLLMTSLGETIVVADLSIGEYAFAMTLHSSDGWATYGFHISVGEVTEPSREPHTIGTITEVRQQGEDLSILIVEHPENPNAGDQMYITVRPNSRVFERTADGVERRAVDDLQVGMRVTVAITGEIASSYPGYAYGSEVVIVRTETEGPLDLGDLVTMTFRHSQITGFSAIPGGDRLYVAYSITSGASGEIVLCANDEPGAETCASGYEFRAEVDVPRGAELDFTVYRLSRDNPDEPEVVKQGREVVDADMITRSWYRYGASNPGGY